MSKKPYRIIFDNILPEIAVAGYEDRKTPSAPTPDNALYKDNIFPNPITHNTIQYSNELSAKSGSSISETTISSAEIADIVGKTISNMRVYVLESDITDAQNTVKSVVDLASF